MADVNWKKYNCDLCLMVGLVLAAVVSALATLVLSKIGLPVWLLAVLFLAVWGGLFIVVDRYCQGRAMAAASANAGHAAASAGGGAAHREVFPEAAPAAAGSAGHREVFPEAASAAGGASTAPGTAPQQAFAEAPAPSPLRSADPLDRDGDGVVEGENEGTRPEALDGPRGGVADDLKRIKGVGPKLEQLCHRLGFFHFDQIAKWSADEVAWVDSNLEGFKGRVTRDDWVAQARVLAEGGETEFSKRVDDGGVPSSQG